MKLIHPEQQYSEIEICPQQDRVCVFVTQGNAVAIHSTGFDGEQSVIIEAAYLGSLIKALQQLEKDVCPS